jgi:ABC-type glycerol-3-phosphate transport system substrate-binding protein
LTELIAAGDVPDIVNNLRPDRENREVLRDISDQEWLGEVPLAAAYEIDGEQYMAHAGIQLQGLWFYNKDAFAEAGIGELPTTTAELEAAMDALSGAGYVPIQTAGSFVTQQGFWGLGVPTVLGNDPEWYANMRDGSTSFSDSYGDWVERWEGWVDAGYMSDDAMGLTYDDATAAFFAGESAIYPMGSWLVGLEEGLAQSGCDQRVLAFWHMREGVAQPIDAEAVEKAEAV